MNGAAEARAGFGYDELDSTVRRLAGEISAAYPNGVQFVCVLKASIFFASDLLRRVCVPCSVDFLGISPYAPGTGRVRIVKDLDHDICGEDIVVLECMVDTGLTCSYILGELKRRGPASLEVCTLFDRRSRRIVPVTLRFVGYEAPAELLLGYGLGFAERYRNLPAVAVGDEEVVLADPDAYVEHLYRR